MALRFPPEVLTEILSYAKNDGIEITNPNTYPTNFSLVCKSWHVLTLSAPEIWSHIRINLDHGENTPPVSHDTTIEYKIVDDSLGPRILPALRTCLERSGLLKPLTLHIRAREFTVTGSEKKKDLLASILSTLLRHAQRWSEVSFDFPIDAFVFMFPLGRSYPRLRGLYLPHGVQDTLVPSSRRVGTFSNAPALRELHLYRFPSSFSQLSIPWSQITHFSISVPVDTPSSTAMGLLELMPNLHSLTLHHIVPLSVHLNTLFTPLPSESPLDLLALEKLKICSSSAYIEIHPYLKRIYAPRLTTLELQLLARQYPGNWISEFEGLISRSRCLVTCLKLKNISGTLVLVLLKAVSPNVEILELEDIQFSKDLLNGMTIPRGMSSLSPSPNARGKLCLGQRIKRLVIKRPGFVDPEKGPSTFISMIRSRLPALQPNQPPIFHPNPAAPPTPSIIPENGNVPLTSLQVVTQQPHRTPHGSGILFPTGQMAAGLYRRLVKNFTKSDYEILGVKLEILEEGASQKSTAPEDDER